MMNERCSLISIKNCVANRSTKATILLRMRFLINDFTGTLLILSKNNYELVKVSD